MRCLVSGKPGVVPASMARLKLGCPTNVAGDRDGQTNRPQREQTCQGIGLAAKLAKRPSHRRAQILGPPSTVLAPRARKVGVIRNGRRGIDRDMDHRVVIGKCFELLHQSSTCNACGFKPHNSGRCGLGHQLGPRMLVKEPPRQEDAIRMATTQLGHHRRRMAVARRLKCGDEDRCHASKVSGE